MTIRRTIETFFLFVSLSGFCFASTIAHADEYANARLLASQCAQCHGTNGVAVGNIESLAGAEYWDLYDKMLDMNRPGETGDVMKHQAKGYTEKQIVLIAEYYASLPKPEDTQKEEEEEEEEEEERED